MHGMRLTLGFSALMFSWLVAANGQSTDTLWSATSSGNWSAGANWRGGTAPATSGTTVHLANLTAGSAVTSTVDAAWAAAGSVNGLVFDTGDGRSTSTGAYTLKGSGLTSFGVGAGGLRMLDLFPGSAQHEIATPLTLTANQTWGGLAPVGGSWPAGPPTYTLRLTQAVAGSTAGIVLTKTGIFGLIVRGANGAFGANIGSIVLGGGALAFANGTTAGNNGNRIDNNTGLTSQGGALVLKPRTDAAGTEDIGPLTLGSGQLRINCETTVLDGTSKATRYRFASLNSGIGASATLVYQPVVGTVVRFTSVTGIPAINGIVGGWAMYSGGTEAEYCTWLAPPTADTDLAYVNGTDRANLNDVVGTTENVDLTSAAPATLTANRTLNSLRYANTSASGTINLGGFQLRLVSGGIANGATSANYGLTFNNGTLTVGELDNSGGTLYLMQGRGGRNITLSTATVVDNGTGPVNVVCSGAPTTVYTFSANNSYSGFTAVNGTPYPIVPSGANTGWTTLSFGSDGASGGDNAPLGKVPSSFVANSIRVNGGALKPSAATTLHANRGIEVSGAGLLADITEANLTINGAISGDGDVVVDGSDSKNCSLAGSSANTYTGNTTIYRKLHLKKSSGNAVPGDVYVLGGESMGSHRGLEWHGPGSDQVADAAVVTLVRAFGSSGGTSYLRLRGFSETIGGLVGTVNTGGEALLVVDNGNAGASTLTIGTAAGSRYRYEGLLQNGSGGTLALAVGGSGIQEIAGTNTYSAGTTVNGGTLQVNNASGSGTGTGSVAVNANGILGGTGIIRPTGANGVTVGGTLAPGASVGTLTVDLGSTTGGVTLSPGAKLSLELGAPGTGDSLRFLNVLAAADVAFNGATIELTDAGNMAPGTYTIMRFYSDGGTALTDTGKPTSGLVVAPGPDRWVGQLDYATPGEIRLVVTESSSGTIVLVR